MYHLTADQKRIYFARRLKEKRRKPPKRGKRILYPERIEAQYVRALQSVVDFIRAKIRQRIVPMLPGLIATIGRVRKDAEASRNPKYYTAFLFEGITDPEVAHCTHKYLGELDAKTVRQVEKAIDAYFIESTPELPHIVFDRPALFGEARDVRVLIPSTNPTQSIWPHLRARLDPFRPDDHGAYRPHVTTREESFDRPFSRYALIRDGQVIRSWPKAVRMDDGEDFEDLATQFARTRIEVTQEFSPEELRRLAMLTGKSVDEWNAKQMNGQLASVLELDIFGAEPWLKKEMGAFVVSNVQLITSIESEYLGQVETLIANSVRAGIRVEGIQAEIEARYDVASSRAALIARDQVGKFNGQLTETRQKDLGIDTYRWRDSQDARVRPSHRENSARDVGYGPGVYRWDDPPEETGHPGQDYQCRCWADPVLDKFFKSEEDTDE